MIEASVHRIHLPRGTAVSVRVGAEIRPDEVIGMRRGALSPVRVPVKNRSESVCRCSKRVVRRRWRTDWVVRWRHQL